MKKIKYIIAIIFIVFLAANISDYIMQERFKSICIEQMEMMNKSDFPNKDDEKRFNDLHSKKELIAHFWNNSIWNFLVVIEKRR